jgi:hypothetical protein
MEGPPSRGTGHHHHHHKALEGRKPVKNLGGKSRLALGKLLRERANA